MVKQNPMEFVGCKEWQSELISDSYHRDVLPTLSALDLVQFIF
jgi:hypothetical protein